MLAEALAAGLNPRELERLIRGHASKEQVADAFGLSVAVVEAMIGRAPGTVDRGLFGQRR